MPNKFLLALLMISYCTVSLAVASDINASVEPNPQNEQAVKAIPKDEVSIPLAQEQTLIRLKETKGNMIKLNTAGNILAADSENWDCVHQKSSELTWEVKSTSGLRDKTNTYTWIPDGPDQGDILSWFKNVQGKCTGDARCETSDYIAKINQQKLCSFSDWRLPTKAELESLIMMGKAKDEAKIDSQYFPNTLASWYWTADINETHPDFAWYVLFKNGVSLSDKKNNAKHLRLVRSNI